MERIDQDAIEIDKKVLLLGAAYERIAANVEHKTVDRLTDTDLTQFFQATLLLSLYTSDPQFTKPMARAFAALGKRHLDTPDLRKKMLDHYVASRMLDAVRSFARRHRNAGLPALPAFEDASSGKQPTLWQLSNHGAALVRHDFSATHSAYVVVVSSPWCPFSRAASKAIEGDAKLHQLMANYSTWIIPQGPIAGFTDIQWWNAGMPSCRCKLSTSEANGQRSHRGQHPTFISSTMGAWWHE